MNKNFATIIQQTRDKAVADGFIAMEKVCLIGMHNVLSDYFEDEQLDKVLRDIEKECADIWSQCVAEAKKNRATAGDPKATEIGEWIWGHAEQIRRMRHMDEGD